jgi:putative tryptophan/tyrosine transport system substrate-binding protein
MRRRAFISLLGGAAASSVVRPLAARAQQPVRMPRIGFTWTDRIAAFRRGLRELGYIEGRNILVEWRWAANEEALREVAAEFVRMKVDVIFAPSSTQVEPARQVTQTIPIVFAYHADPIGVGHVASLPRPGGNVTGLSMLLTDLAAKELEILTEALPRARRIGVLWNPTTPSHGPAVQAVKDAGAKLGIDLVLQSAPTADAFDGAFVSFVQQGAEGFLVVSSPLGTAYRTSLAELELRHRLPGMFGHKDHVEAGGLMSYGADIDDLVRRATVYIDKILKGAKPADLPVEQASKYQLVINLKTATALGLELPLTLLARADEVIE